MRNKDRANIIVVIIFLFCFATVSAILIVDYYLANKPILPIMEIAPKNILQSGIEPKKIDEITIEGNSGLIVTYQINDSADAENEGKTNVVDIVYTNNQYNYVMNYPIVSGSFFTEQNYVQSDKVVVLNKKAAGMLFGGTDICGLNLTIKGKDYIIQGVMDDGSDEKNVYLLSSETEMQPNHFYAYVDENSLPMQIERVLDKIGISKKNYKFVQKDYDYSAK